MKHFKIIFLTTLALFIFGCEPSDSSIEKMISSKKVNEVVEGYFLIGKYKKTDFIKVMFIDEKDSRISHDLRFYGISVYQSKMGALRKIFNVSPPNLIDYKYDSVNVKFYKRWAFMGGYLN